MKGNLKNIFLAVCFICSFKNNYAQSEDSLYASPTSFYSSTNIHFAITSKDTVSLFVYDRWGTILLNSPKDSIMEAGSYSVSFRNDNIPSGIYLLFLRFNTKKPIITTMYKVALFSKSGKSFLNSNTTWNYLNCETSFVNGDGDPFDTIPHYPVKYCNTTYQYTSGDTTINSKLFYRLFSKEKIDDLPYFIGTLQEDSLGIVTMIHPDDTTEYRLYNFGGNVGDTMDELFETTITKIDTVLLGNYFRRRIITSNKDTIVEGIGNLNRIFGLYMYPDATPEFKLLCNSSNYINEQYQNCDTIFNTTYSRELLKDSPPILFPNPSKGIVSLLVRENQENSTPLIISNSLGQTVLIQFITGRKTEINMSSLPKGIYFMQYQVKDGQRHEKIILE